MAATTQATKRGEMATEVGNSTETMTKTGRPDVRNWFGDLSWDASALVEARSVEDIVAVMRDAEIELHLMEARQVDEQARQ